MVWVLGDVTMYLNTPYCTNVWARANLVSQLGRANLVSRDRNDPPDWISPLAAELRASDGAGRVAPATPARRPGTRSRPKDNRESWHATAPRRGPEDQGLAPRDCVA